MVGTGEGGGVAGGRVGGGTGGSPLTSVMLPSVAPRPLFTAMQIPPENFICRKPDLRGVPKNRNAAKNFISEAVL